MTRYILHFDFTSCLPSSGTWFVQRAIRCQTVSTTEVIHICHTGDKPPCCKQHARKRGSPANGLCKLLAFSKTGNLVPCCCRRVRSLAQRWASKRAEQFQCRCNSTDFCAEPFGKGHALTAPNAKLNWVMADGMSSSLGAQKHINRQQAMRLEIRRPE